MTHVDTAAQVGLPVACAIFLVLSSLSFSRCDADGDVDGDVDDDDEDEEVCSCQSTASAVLSVMPAGDIKQARD